MKAILLDGSFATDSFSDRVTRALTTELRTQGWDIEYVILRDKKIGNCSGDFFCWIRSPGICHINDDNRDLAAAIIASDLLIYLTPVTFGGYSSVLKRMVDHQIQNISPFFASIDGETHHEKRYVKYPDFLVVGWMDEPDERAEAVFRFLVQRNAINFYAQNFVTGIILTSHSNGEITTLAQGWLMNLRNCQSSVRVKLPDVKVTLNGNIHIRKALLLVGSPRTRNSNSNSIGEYLFDQLRTQSITTDKIYLYTVLRTPEKLRAFDEAIEAADLIVLAFPLYVDSLPSPVIELLEYIAANRKGLKRRGQLFAAIANCGFPEAQHNMTALRICELFAGHAGFEWAGSLALGGGEAIAGKPLIEGGGRTIHIRKSLDDAAEALRQGHAIPQSAQEKIGKSVIPHWVYRMVGGLGWKKQARRYGADESLREQPYEVKPEK